MQPFIKVKFIGESFQGDSLKRKMTKTIKIKEVIIKMRKKT